MLCNLLRRNLERIEEDCMEGYHASLSNQLKEVTERFFLDWCDQVPSKRRGTTVPIR
jgi:hypothetical protein